MGYARLLQLTVALTLCLSANVASAAFISFVEDPAETSPVTVLTDLLSITGGSPTINATPETASVSGYHFPQISPVPLLTGTYWGGLTEPGSGVLSDLVRVVAGTPTTTCGSLPGIPPFLCQLLEISFWSDSEGGPPLESLIPSGVAVATIEEDGTLQDLSQLMGTLPNGTEGLTVKVQSDPSIPEAGTLALLSLGLAGLAASRRRKQ